ncbi:MAG: benzoyl-CoA-dihydrodiol lyase [Polyangiaceae bacterium]|nr:benzoyl-CoA-dihydrodiol lyase [Polyangiaceae bacterium]
MEHAAPSSQEPIRFEAHPSGYKHWVLTFDGPIARLAMDVNQEHPLRPGYELKLNSYDLGVDIELADAVERIRFEHPEVKVVLVTSAQPRIFCAGANIYMLGSSTHAFKVNFCKFTNETRNSLEEACSESGQHYVAALNGVSSGGGYELALACEKILLADDGNSAVSFPETPLLAVLPGTGGLTRLVDKRKVRRDLADVFSTLAEGIRGRRAQEWNLVDESIAKSKFDATVKERALTMAAATPDKVGAGLTLAPVTPKRSTEKGWLKSEYTHVTLTVKPNDRLAEIEVRGPSSAESLAGESLRAAGNDLWIFRAFRELNDALLDLRFNHETAGLVLLTTKGDPEKVRAADKALLDLEASGDWLAHEIRLYVKRTLKRLDLSARSMFAILTKGSCFAGSLFELALAADRSYMLDDEDEPVQIGLSGMNHGPLPMSNGLTRLQTRFLGRPAIPTELVGVTELMDAATAKERGLVTFTPDAMDWDDEVRLAIEERVSLSPDALTGMEANLRFAGPETMETKIFARLSAWQNWIFQRPNAVGEKGALTMYGRPERPELDWRRT